MIGAPAACGSFGLPRNTASANTVFTRLIPPFCGYSCTPPKLFLVDPASTSTSAPKNNFSGPSDAFTHLTDLWYTSVTTAHSIYIMRPLNYTWLTSAVTSSVTTLTVAFDPGTWATAGIYKYGVATAGGVPAYANDTQASGDYYAYQCTDGTWQVDVATTNTTGTTLVLTTGTPAVAGAGIAAYSPIYWFGVQTDTDPATGMIHPVFDTIANTNLTSQLKTGGLDLVRSLHRGDPMIFQSSNGTNAGFLELLSGYYSTQF